ncbi:hypothetical protein ALC56_08548 [Trachymyrmex septentrionalis]|uniref:Uncharacterized protein n=1 Tax=Trachymyrmex septentrionalis TaxID=34720 RepID=A0A195F972_9HYME|nr:hypothetical protein ALC56_08548 [Trachymyrmex septentrionalis]
MANCVNTTYCGTHGVLPYTTILQSTPPTSLRWATPQLKHFRNNPLSPTWIKLEPTSWRLFSALSNANTAYSNVGTELPRHANFDAYVIQQLLHRDPKAISSITWYTMTILATGKSNFSTS